MSHSAMKTFETRTFGKWILAGEHSVLRGGEALVFPLKSQWLDWRFEPGGSSFHVETPKGYPEEFKLLFWSVFEKACQLCQIPQNQFLGKLEMRAQIQVGSGLGASATLCVALTRWFVSLGYVSQDNAFLFAKKLEDVFHGESSGVDVAVVLRETGLIFRRDHEPLVFKAHYQPLWFLSHCGEKGITKECVLKVKNLGIRNPSLLAEIDAKMKTSVDMCKELLSNPENSTSFGKLQEALSLGLECFRAWDLVTPSLQKHMQLLKNEGARAVKPTGSGGGGFVLSLWDKMPDENFMIENRMLKASVL